METDEYLFEFFRKRPLELLRLLRLPMEGHWRFESVSIKRKKSEKRFDGLMFRDAHDGPQIYAEFLASPLPKVYWRLFRAIAMYNELTDEPTRPFIAVVVFLDRAIDPGFTGWTVNPPNQLITLYLEERLEQLEGEDGPLLALMPLGVRRVEGLGPRARDWAARIQRLPEPPDRIKFLMEMLSYSILQRCPHLPLEELEAMLQLTPLKETRAVKDLLRLEGDAREAKGEARGEARGEAKGIRIGEIRTLQRVLNRPQLSMEALGGMSLAALDALIEALERDLE